MPLSVTLLPSTWKDIVMTRKKEREWEREKERKKEINEEKEWEREREMKYERARQREGCLRSWLHGGDVYDVVSRGGFSNQGVS